MGAESGIKAPETGAGSVGEGENAPETGAVSRKGRFLACFGAPGRVNCPTVPSAQNS